MEIHILLIKLQQSHNLFIKMQLKCSRVIENEIRSEVLPYRYAFDTLLS